MFPRRKFWLLVLSLGAMLLSLGVGLSAAARPIRILFLHHSCGHNLIEQGGVREGLTALGYEFYDHGYNDDGLRLADGSYTGTNFDVPDDNTDPDGYAAIFSQPLHDPPDNTFSYLMQYDVIAFKSCFPVSNVGSDEQLAEYKSYYLTIRDRMDEYPNKIFVIVTQPPQVPNNSSPEEADRARAFTVWLQSDEFLAGHPNVFVFDFFGLLAGEDNFLRAEYRSDEYDAHPNERANQVIGPQFVAFFDEVIKGHQGSQPISSPSPEPTATPETESQTEPTSPPPEVEVVTGLLDGFESGEVAWETDAETDSSIECTPDGGDAHTGAAALRLRYTVTADGWADCGRYFDTRQDWSAGEGVTFFIKHQGDAQQMTVLLFSGDPDAPTPFAAEVSLPTENNWQQVALPWESFEKAEWAEEGNLSALVPAQITGYGFTLETGEDCAGELWLDDLSLITEAETTASPPETPTESAPQESEEPDDGGGMCAAAALAPLALFVSLSRKRKP